ncbi:DUF2127 domain-containing protein [Streptomyces noursei]|uniref:DUF2127 domain-containing protein n=1 Tax=Streptomyces noursei TaxID=1971 RepID=UPI00081C2F47|nr:DUF2127 domain-containing protein [Streptomyces noursei]ANZ14134.1 putative membrane protein [Streptomyces noursei ATCC 11455]MCZ1020249.1 DUF2127 domain-containing protein [Streptomyces noursei]GGX41315.1 hypothetical protein GCM10010341_74090 [Streptomyces noursei]
MAEEDGDAPAPVPGTGDDRRRLRYELLSCALHGHHLEGVGAERVRPTDGLLVREDPEGLRWHRCLRCDAWVPVTPRPQPDRPHPPDRDEIALPLRGKPLRDRYVLRLIALDRLLHFVVLGALATGILVFADKRASLQAPFYRFMDLLQNGVGGAGGVSDRGLLGEVAKAFAVRSSTLWLIGLVIAAYALLEGVEAVGLWFGRRWAEYLTFVATTVLLAPEVYELLSRVTVTKVLTLLVNLAVVIYLLFAKRLFGVRGGGRAEAAERARDVSWEALERVPPARTAD